MNENIELPRMSREDRDKLIDGSPEYFLMGDVIDSTYVKTVEMCVEFLRERAGIYKGGPRVCLRAAADALADTIRGEGDE